MSTPLKCNIKDCPTKNLSYRAKRLVKVPSIAKVCKTKLISKNNRDEHKCYCLKRKIQSEKDNTG